MAWLVAGLGNPGARYARTRHNLGRLVVESMAEEAGERLRKVRFLPIERAEVAIGDERVTLAISTGYMNESGPSYASLAKKLEVDVDRVVAVHDELDVAKGTLRLKTGGSTAGHNGLRSLERALRSREFHRIRIGIGRPPGRQDPADFVLAHTGTREQEDLLASAAHAADAVRALILDGVSVAQERYNNTGPGG